MKHVKLYEQYVNELFHVLKKYPWKKIAELIKKWADENKDKDPKIKLMMTPENIEWIAQKMEDQVNAAYDEKKKIPTDFKWEMHDNNYYFACYDQEGEQITYKDMHKANDPAALIGTF